MIYTTPPLISETSLSTCPSLSFQPPWHFFLPSLLSAFNFKYHPLPALRDQVWSPYSLSPLPGLIQLTFISLLFCFPLSICHPLKSPGVSQCGRCYQLSTQPLFILCYSKESDHVPWAMLPARAVDHYGTRPVTATVLPFEEITVGGRGEQCGYILVSGMQG